MIATPGLTIKVLEKEPYAGSYQGLRFTYRKAGDALEAILYPEPWCLEKTPEENRHTKEFPFTGEGLKEAVVWTEEMYQTSIGDTSN